MMPGTRVVRLKELKGGARPVMPQNGRRVPKRHAELTRIVSLFRNFCYTELTMLKGKSNAIELLI